MKPSKYKYTYYQNTHNFQNTQTLKNPYIHTPAHYKHTHTHNKIYTYIPPHITKPTHTHTYITKQFKTTSLIYPQNSTLFVSSS
jgi:hypothetical protein